MGYGYQIAYQIQYGINIFLNIVSWMLAIYCLMTWFVRPGSSMYTFMQRLIEPIVAPFRPLARRLMERGLMLDVSIVLAIFGVRILRNLVNAIFNTLIYHLL